MRKVASLVPDAIMLSGVGGALAGLYVLFGLGVVLLVGGLMLAVGGFLWDVGWFSRER